MKAKGNWQNQMKEWYNYHLKLQTTIHSWLLLDEVLFFSLTLCQNMSTFYVFCKIVSPKHVLDVFSAPGHWVELFPLALGQATQGTSLEYHKAYLKREFFFLSFYTIPL